MRKIIAIIISLSQIYINNDHLEASSQTGEQTTNTRHIKQKIQERRFCSFLSIYCHVCPWAFKNIHKTSLETKFACPLSRWELEFGRALQKRQAWNKWTLKLGTARHSPLAARCTTGVLRSIIWNEQVRVTRRREKETYWRQHRLLGMLPRGVRFRPSCVPCFSSYDRTLHYLRADARREIQEVIGTSTGFLQNI